MRSHPIYGQHHVICGSYPVFLRRVVRETEHRVLRTRKSPGQLEQQVHDLLHLIHVQLVLVVLGFVLTLGLHHCSQLQRTTRRIQIKNVEKRELCLCLEWLVYHSLELCTRKETGSFTSLPSRLFSLTSASRNSLSSRRISSFLSIRFCSSSWKRTRKIRLSLSCPVQILWSSRAAVSFLFYFRLPHAPFVCREACWRPEYRWRQRHSAETKLWKSWAVMSSTYKKIPVTTRM